MKSHIDLIWLGQAQPIPTWEYGQVIPAPLTVQAVADVIDQHLSVSQAAAWLLWDSSLPLPNIDVLTTLLASPIQVWHGGLRLGMAGQPALIDAVAPTWMLNRDPSPDQAAVSWRLSLRACLIRLDTLRQIGSIRRDYTTLEAAALEMGHRGIRQGALIMHTPTLVAQHGSSVTLPISDQLRFLRHRFGRMWAAWAHLRAVLNFTRVDLSESHTNISAPCSPIPASQSLISVIIPTLGRYPYLRRLLDQLHKQTHPPSEIIVLDQTPSPHRDSTLATEFSTLPFQFYSVESGGQCLARNIGIQRSTGDYILLLDDDDDIHSDLIAQHLKVLIELGADASCGAVHEVGAELLNADYTLLRISDGFPANNTMVRRAALRRSGLFDLAYDRQTREDADLGMRLVQTGALLIHNPHATVIHHRAGVGGLRTYGERVVTYASSRRSLTHRHLPSTAELYYLTRYFSAQQIREAMWLYVLGTFSIRGNLLKRLIKALVAFVLLPDTCIRLLQRKRAAQQISPHIPPLDN